MFQAITADAAQPSDHPNGDPEIIARLREALSYQRKLPVFSRGQMFFDFDLGKVRIAT